MTHSFYHLYLTGYRGSGKTSVGAWLAKRLALPAIDLDDRIEQAAGKSIHQIFAAVGEAGFREQESKALTLVAAEPRSIVSLGGGAILRAENRRLIHTSGFCVWLDIDADSAFKRLAKDGMTPARRPALTSLPAREEIATLLQQRAPLYGLAANARVNVTEKNIDLVGEEILALLPS